MTKKANMRQNSIVTLTDHNKEEIEKLKMQREQIIKDYEEKKIGMFLFSFKINTRDKLNFLLISPAKKFDSKAKFSQ